MSQISLTKFDQPLQIELEPSRQLARLSLVVHMLGGLAWLLVTFPVIYKLAALIFISGHARYFHQLQIAANSASSVSGIAWDKKRGWRVYNPAKGWQTAVLQMPVCVTPRLVAARFRVSRFRCCSAVIVGDRLAGDKFRRLRVRLLQSTRGHRNRAQIPGEG
jgi:hypothetical protein